MSREELIDYLESKDFDAEEINKLLVFSGNHEKINLMLNLEFIYEILTYTGLIEEQIKLFVLQNLKVLTQDKSEIIKIAYVLNDADLISRLFGRLDCVRGIYLYKRIFMRNLLVNFSKRYINPVGAKFLICSDARAYVTDFNLSEYAYYLFKETVHSDDELESILNKQIKMNGENVTVDKYIEVNSKLFYNKYLMSKLRKGKQR